MCRSPFKAIPHPLSQINGLDLTPILQVINLAPSSAPSPAMTSSPSSTIPPEIVAFATRVYDAARQGQMDFFRQALPAGLSANMTNHKGDSLVPTSLPPACAGILV